MDKTKNYLLVLDEMLRKLRDSDGRLHWSDFAVIKLTADKLGVSLNERQELWDKLEHDKYAYKDDGGYVHINASGLIFIDNEGYTGQQRRETISKNLQTIGNVLLTVGSIAAIGLLIMEILKYGHHLTWE